MSARQDGAWPSARLCEVSRDIVGVSGAGVMIMSGDTPQGSLCTTNEISNLIEELQFTLGEGPCVDAYTETRVVVEADLAHPDKPRWLAFTPQAVDAGVRAVFAFPLRVDTVKLGALDLYRDQPGPLRAEQLADALVMADVVARWVLEVQAHAPAGDVARELAQDADFHFVVHQAAGAVSVQLGISIPEALIRLRAYAFSHDRLLKDVAADVITRTLQVE